PGTHLEVGGGDLRVRARHGDQSGLVGGGETTRLGGSPDQHRPVHLDVLAVGEDQPGDRPCRDAGRLRLAGDAGVLAGELVLVHGAGNGVAVVVVVLDVAAALGGRSPTGRGRGGRSQRVIPPGRGCGRGRGRTPCGRRRYVVTARRLPCRRVTGV